MTHEELMKLAQTGDLTDDLVIKLTQETRRSMLVNTIAEGIPQGKDMYRVMKLMEDMDATAFNSKKLESDDANADADRKAAIMISSMNKQIGGINPFESSVDSPRQEKDITPDESDIPVIDPKLEENAIGVSTLTYDEFIREES